jgi:hypothetical protein
MSSKKKEEKVVDDSWTPVPRGKTYCSPACGCGCTRRDHDRAVRDADRLVCILAGSGWKSVVWENSGWHFGAVSGPVQVYGDRRGRNGRLRYTCLISDLVDGSPGGSLIWTAQTSHPYDDPSEAVADEFKKALLATTGVVRAVYAAYEASGGPTVGLLPLAKTLLLKLAAQITGGRTP